MCIVPKRCNDMMNIGRLQGFDVGPYETETRQYERHRITWPSLWPPRGRLQPRAGCCSRTPSWCPTRRGFCSVGWRRGECSCLSSWSSSANPWINRRVWVCRASSTRTASRYREFPPPPKIRASEDAASRFALQVSCLGLEESVEGDPCKFILTSRSPGGALESFVLHSSHLGVREVWTLQIQQILGSQRNCLSGKLCAERSEDVGLH